MEESKDDAMWKGGAGGRDSFNGTPQEDDWALKYFELKENNDRVTKKLIAIGKEKRVIVTEAIQAKQDLEQC